MCDGFDADPPPRKKRSRDPGVPKDWVCRANSQERCRAGDHAWYPPDYVLTPVEQATAGGDYLTMDDTDEDD